jgi:hypothetical protein
MNDTLKVEFKCRENVDSHLGIHDEIYLKILGQEFIEHFSVDKHSILKYDRERARLFGMKLQEIGLQIQRQAEKGKPQIIKIQKFGYERELVLF